MFIQCFQRILCLKGILEIHFKFCIPRGSDGKESACNVEDPGLIPGLGRSHRILNIVPCAIQWDPVTYLFYDSSLYVNTYS